MPTYDIYTVAQRMSRNKKARIKYHNLECSLKLNILEPSDPDQLDSADRSAISLAGRMFGGAVSKIVRRELVPKPHVIMEEDI